MNIRKRFWYAYGWIFVRPRRWFFWQMITNTSPMWLPEWNDCWGRYDWPNIHWWILYKTVFKFFKWLNYDAWRPFCKWGRIRLTFPLIARIIQRIGQTTAGYAISGGECFHCSSEKGAPVDLSNDETGIKFILEREWSEGTENGTDYRFCGTTICPVCGYKRYYEDGSL